MGGSFWFLMKISHKNSTNWLSITKQKTAGIKDWLFKKNDRIRFAQFQFLIRKKKKKQQQQKTPLPSI